MLWARLRFVLGPVLGQGSNELRQRPKNIRTLLLLLLLRALVKYNLKNVTTVRAISTMFLSPKLQENGLHIAMDFRFWLPSYIRISLTVIFHWFISNDSARQILYFNPQNAYNARQSRLTRWGKRIKISTGKGKKF